jgi:hypothetical protein
MLIPFFISSLLSLRALSQKISLAQLIHFIKKRTRNSSAQVHPVSGALDYAFFTSPLHSQKFHSQKFHSQKFHSQTFLAEVLPGHKEQFYDTKSQNCLRELGPKDYHFWDTYQLFAQDSWRKRDEVSETEARSLHLKRQARVMPS